MRCLVVGGTGFLGGAIVGALRDAGHSVTILSRGKTAPRDMPGIELIRADRYEDLAPLQHRSFGWVFDTCAYTPSSVERLLKAVGRDLERYVLISSVSVYGTYATPGLSEDATVPDASAKDFETATRLRADDRSSAFAYGASYGPLKRACEQQANDMLGGRATSLRVGLLVGAGDYTDRLTWWVRRLDEAAGDRAMVPVPAPIDRPVQMIDVNDAARFAVRSATKNLPGLWNVTGEPLPLGEVLSTIGRISHSRARFIPVEEQVIANSIVKPWTDIPLMAPPVPEFRYFLSINTAKAKSAGLVCRPLEDTLASLLDWDRSRRDVQLKCGMTADQETLLLNAAM